MIWTKTLAMLTDENDGMLYLSPSPKPLAVLRPSVRLSCADALALYYSDRSGTYVSSWPSDIEAAFPGCCLAFSALASVVVSGTYVLLTSYPGFFRHSDLAAAPPFVEDAAINGYCILIALAHMFFLAF